MRKWLPVFVVFSVVGAAVAYAAEAAPVAAAEAVKEVSIWSVVGKGALMGLAATLVGWLKNADPGKFDPRGLVLKLPIGAVVGGIAAYQGIDFDSAMSWAVGVGLVTILDQVIKLVLRRIGSGWAYEIMNATADPTAPVPTTPPSAP